MSIKTKDLRPCDICGGPIAPIFYRLEIKFRQVGIDYGAVNQVLGTAAILGNNLLLGSMMSPDQDVLIDLGYQVDKDIWLCQECCLGRPGEQPFTLRPVDLMTEAEAAQHAAEEERP